MSKTCYYCNSEATTVEHIPPKNLFPAIHELGIDFRKNLITVPSCEEHNNKKSNSDERLRQILVGSGLTNKIGQALLPSKWKRSFERSPKLLRDEIFQGKRVKYMSEEDTEYQVGILAKINFEEIDDLLIKICSGLYYNETGKKLTGSPFLITGFTIYLNKLQQKTNEIELSKVRKFFSSSKCIGENPEVFYYNRRFNSNIITFLLVFYEYNEVLVRFY